MRLKTNDAAEGELFALLMETAAELAGQRTFEEIEASITENRDKFDNPEIIRERYKQILELPSVCSRGDDWAEFPDTHLRAVVMSLQIVGQRVAAHLLSEGRLIEMLIHVDTVGNFLNQLSPFMRPEKLNG